MENKRKDILEAKASVIVQSASIATSIVALAPAMLDKPWVLSIGWSFFVILFYFLAVTHLIISVAYAVRARRVRDYSMVGADALIDVMERSSAGNLEGKLAARQITDAKWNEDALTMKANELSVAEDLLLRGLAFFAAAVTIAILRTSSFYLEKHLQAILPFAGGLFR